MSMEAIQPIQFSSLQALPSWAQEAREKQAILDDPQVNKYLESIGAEAQEISRFAILDNGNKEYLVRTNTEYFIRVTVVYTPDKQNLGPRVFELDVRSPELPQKHATGLLIPAHLKG